MKPFPRIRLELLGIEVLHLRPAQNAIRQKHGPRYHVMDECLRDVAALWGIEPPLACINDAGVFIPYESVERRAGRCCAELRYASSPSGLWAMTTSYATAMSGGGSSPSVWNAFAFQSEADARAAGLHDLMSLFRGMADQGMTDARKLVELLEDERTPQLSLF